MSKKPIIGIVATSNYNLTNDTFSDTYRYGNNYIKAICDNGGIPLLIPYIDDKVCYDSLEMCDGLILPGGNKVMASALEIVDSRQEKAQGTVSLGLSHNTFCSSSVKNLMVRISKSFQ